MAVVGARRGDELHARLVELPKGKVICEGTAALGIDGKVTSTVEDSLLAAAVSRPFCELVDCSGLSPKPSAKPEAPTPTKSKAKTAAPTKASAPGESLSRESILSVVKAASARTRSCYERGLAKHPTLQGKLTVSLMIAGNGKVNSATGSGFPNQAVTDCVVKVFQGMRFPASADGKITPVKYPIVFSPG